MIDSDIKAEFDDVMTSNQLGFSNVDSLDLLNNLDDLETPFKFDSRYHGVDEVLNHPPQWNQQQSVGQDVSAINSTYFDDSLSNSNNVMVNPNSVMPVHQQQQQQQQQQHYAPVPSPVPPHQPLLTVNTQINTYSPHPLPLPLGTVLSLVVSPSQSPPARTDASCEKGQDFVRKDRGQDFILKAASSIRDTAHLIGEAAHKYSLSPAGVKSNGGGSKASEYSKRGSARHLEDVV